MKYILKFNTDSEHTTWMGNNVNENKYVHVAQIGGPVGNNYFVTIEYFRFSNAVVKGGETNK